MKLMITAVGMLAFSAAVAGSGVTFRSASKGPQQVPDAAFVAFEALVPIGAADSVVMTVRGADGKALVESRQAVKTGRNALTLHIETLPAGKYDVIFRATSTHDRVVAIATNSFVKTGAAATLAAEKRYAYTADGSRAELAPGKIRAADLTPLAAVGTPRGNPIVAVADGVAHLAIVATEANDKARWLAEVIERMTGAKVPVYYKGTNELFTAGPAIYVGLTRATQEAGFVRPGTPETKWGVGAHAFRCVTKGKDVFIVGANALATSYGVYDFAERVLGVRQYCWTATGKTAEEKAANRAKGEDVIVTDGLAIPQVDWSDRPVYEFRTAFGAGHPGWKLGDAHQSSHNVHAPCYWHVDPNLGYKPSRWTGRPTIFQLEENGERARSPMLCYGNPLTLKTYQEHIKLTIDGKRRGFGSNPVDLERKTVTVSQWDAAVICHCEYCKKLRDPSAAPTGDASPIIWGYFTKELAKWMKKNYPDWRISILPYINTCDVPKGLDLTAEGNVDAYLCTMPGLALLAQDDCRKHEEDLMRQWQKATGNPVQNWHYICWPADKTCAPYVFGNTAIRFYREMKGVICGSFINGPTGRPGLELSEYVWVRAMWNPGFEAKDVYDEFARRMFGPASVPMRKLIEMQERGWERQWKHASVASKNIFGISYPRKDVEEMERLIGESRGLVKGSGLYESRFNTYAKPFERFFKESYEYANNKAFAQLQMRKTGELPKIDGDLADSCWKLAEPLDFTLSGSGGYGSPTNLVAKYPTKIQAVWTSQGVVLGVTCMEPTPKLLQTKHPAGAWWGNDCLEIFVDPTGEQEGVYGKLWIDPVNQLRTYADKDVKWEPKGLKSGVKINADSWTVEIFIPYSDVKCFEGAKIPGTQGGMNWNGNVTRLRIADGWAKEGRTPGSVAEMQRLYTRFSIWNSDPNAFGVWKFVEQ